MALWATGHICCMDERQMETVSCNRSNSEWPPAQWMNSIWVLVCLIFRQSVRILMELELSRTLSAHKARIHLIMWKPNHAMKNVEETQWTCTGKAWISLKGTKKRTVYKNWTEDWASGQQIRSLKSNLSYLCLGNNTEDVSFFFKAPVSQKQTCNVPDFWFLTVISVRLNHTSIPVYRLVKIWQTLVCSSLQSLFLYFHQNGHYQNNLF